MLVILFLSVACSSLPKKANDEFLWLEEIESTRSLDFAKLENEKTLSALQSDPNYKGLEKDLRAIAYAKDRIPWSYPRKGYFYNFWRDEKNSRGLWRRTTLNEYKKNNPKWEIILDLDILSTNEKENWVWHGSSCLPPAYEQCLINLSRGGKDAVVVREFNMRTKKFVEDGFYIPEAKTSVDWIDIDSIYVGTANAEEFVTDSGYARTVRYLKRGQKLIDAPIIFEVDKKDQSASAYVDLTHDKKMQFLTRTFSFYQRENYYFENGVKTLIPMPRDSSFYGYFKGYLIYNLRSELRTSAKTFKAGSLIALPLDKIKDTTLSSLELIFEPTPARFLSSISTTKDFLLLDVMDNIQGKIIKVTFNKPNSWEFENIVIGKNGMASVDATEDDNNNIIISYSDFVTPTSSYIGDITHKKAKFTKIKTSPERYSSKGIVSSQQFAKSRDGVMIPYFIIHNKNIKLDGKNPTLLYGYGGFEVSQQPFYLSAIGKLWLERGGVFVVSNIRGGGEFGPDWHRAALREKRQVVFDDFIAIAEKLISDKITSPRHLGIQGGSNGGLLVGATFVQRPDLFNAVICEVPLLDMLRYHTLLAGASWMDEYGNPDDPKMREAILKYSPYQNVSADKTYPEVFFFTSTKDDRVHPGHARKMVAKMRSQNHPLFYYENIEGGHGGAANIEQSILKGALEYTYLWRKLK